MLLTLICIVVLVVGIVLNLIANEGKYLVLEGVSLICLLLGTICIFVFGICIISAHTGVDLAIETNQIKYETLLKEKQLLETDQEDISKLTVLNDISEWNQNVKSQKHEAYNIWTSWFNNRKVADQLQYITISDIGVNEK